MGPRANLDCERQGEGRAPPREPGLLLSGGLAPASLTAARAGGDAQARTGPVRMLAGPQGGARARAGCLDLLGGCVLGVFAVLAYPREGACGGGFLGKGTYLGRGNCRGRGRARLWGSLRGGSEDCAGLKVV